MDLKLLVSLLCGLLLLGGCQGVSLYAGGGIGGTGISDGTINRFGSVYINGVRFDTDNSQIQIKGRTVSEDDLQLGMVVSIRGAVNSDGLTGTADEIIFQPTLEGAIEVITAPDQLMINGVMVQLSATTMIDPAAVVPFSEGDIVTVSGTFDTENSVHASYIKSGLFSGGAGGASSDSPPDRNSRVDWRITEGFISPGSVVNLYTLADWVVAVNGHTTFVNGRAADIQANTHVVVAGAQFDDNIIVAHRVEFLLDANLTWNSSVTAIDIAKNIIYLDGQAIILRSTTIMQDSSAHMVRRFSIEDLVVGDGLKVSAYAAGGAIIAAKVERTISH